MKSAHNVLVAVLVLAAAHIVFAAEFQEKWVYFECNLRTPEGVDKALARLDQAAAAGCNYALLTDSSHLAAPQMSKDYFDGIARVKDRAASLKMTLIPTVFPTGYGGRYLNLDKNLAAGLGVKNAPFIVKGKTALPDPSALPTIANAGFDESENGALKGWSAEGEGGQAPAADTETFHGGKSSVKFSPAPPAEPTPEGAPRSRRGPWGIVLSQTLAVKPFQLYRLSFWIKADADGRYRPNINVASEKGRRLLFADVPVEPGQDWKKYSVLVNTLDSAELKLSVGIGASGGSAWVDDLELAPVGLLNVVRRVNTPVKVTSADGKTVYVEGKDYGRIADPLLDPYDQAHDAPPLEITDGSRIADGEALLVSWYHSLLINVDQVNATISDPAMFAMMDYEMKCAAQVWGAPGYFMNVDEIRVASWEEGPDGPDKRPSAMLADYTEKAVAIIKKYAPEATVYTWSDMYTPFHNARVLDEGSYYYLVNGGWDGSWEKLPPDVVIMMWSARDKQALEWFSGRGHKQVLCGYYDGDMKRNIIRWMTVSEGVPGVTGMMYTTWKNNYADLAEFFRLVKTYPEWVTDADRQPPRPRRD